MFCSEVLMVASSKSWRVYSFANSSLEAALKWVLILAATGCQTWTKSAAPHSNSNRHQSRNKIQEPSLVKRLLSSLLSEREHSERPLILVYGTLRTEDERKQLCNLESERDCSEGKRFPRKYSIFTFFKSVWSISALIRSTSCTKRDLVGAISSLDAANLHSTSLCLTSRRSNRFYYFLWTQLIRIVRR